jgi:hypothetical protein
LWENFAGLFWLVFLVGHRRSASSVDGVCRDRDIQYDDESPP